jgi:hypothetical protein
MPDVNYIVHISGMPIVLGQFTFGTIAAVTTTTLLVRFFAGNPGPSGTSFLRDPSRAYVTVFSTT